MGAVTEEARRDVYETGNEPDFNICGISRHEDAGDGRIRVYLTSRRGKLDKTEYSVTASPETLLRLSREIGRIAAQYLDVVEFRKAMRDH